VGAGVAGVESRARVGVEAVQVKVERRAARGREVGEVRGLRAWRASVAWMKV